MIIKNINHLLQKISKKTLPVFIALFLLSGFSAKAKGTPFCQVYLNDSLIKTIPFIDFGRTKIVIPHWQKTDTLTIKYWMDTGWQPNDEFIFKTKNDSTLRISTGDANGKTGKIKLSPNDFRIDDCKVYEGYKGLPQYDIFVFEIELKQHQ